MANNVEANPGSGGPVFASDDLGGVQHPYAKIEFGADGTATPVSGANPLPVSAASLPLPSGAATSANQPDVRTSHPLYGDRGSVVRQAPAVFVEHEQRLATEGREPEA